MKRVNTAEEFLAAYKADNEFPEFNLELEDDRVLANVLMQIQLGIMEDSHYATLAETIINRYHGAEKIEKPEIKHRVDASCNRLVNLAIRIELKLTHEMLYYYCAKTCEEFEIGDMQAGTDNIDDDWYMSTLYSKVISKAKMFNLFGWTVPQQLQMVTAQLDKMIPQRDDLNKKISQLLMEKVRLEQENAPAAVSV